MDESVDVVTDDCGETEDGNTVLFLSLVARHSDSQPRCTPWGYGFQTAAVDATRRGLSIATGETYECSLAAHEGAILLTRRRWWSAVSGKIAALISSHFAGYDDWRLPNVRELESLLNFGSTNPSTWGAFHTGCWSGRVLRDRYFTE